MSLEGVAGEARAEKGRFGRVIGEGTMGSRGAFRGEGDGVGSVRKKSDNKLSAVASSKSEKAKHTRKCRGMLGRPRSWSTRGQQFDG